MIRMFKDLPNLTFLEEVIFQMMSLNLSKSQKERLYTFFKRLSIFGIQNNSLLGGEMICSIGSGKTTYQINSKSGNLLITFQTNSETFQIEKLEI